MKTKFEMNFKKVDLSSELRSYLTNDPEADVYSFIGHKGWLDEIKDDFGNYEGVIGMENCYDNLDSSDVVDGEKYLFLFPESGYMMTIKVADILDSLLNDIGVLESI